MSMAIFNSAEGMFTRGYCSSFICADLSGDGEIVCFGWPVKR
jgi:hypothetical protein